MPIQQETLQSFDIQRNACISDLSRKGNVFFYGGRTWWNFATLLLCPRESIFAHIFMTIRQLTAPIECRETKSRALGGVTFHCMRTVCSKMVNFSITATAGASQQFYNLNPNSHNSNSVGYLANDVSQFVSYDNRQRNNYLFICEWLSYHVI